MEIHPASREITGENCILRNTAVPKKTDAAQVTLGRISISSSVDPPAGSLTPESAAAREHHLEAAPSELERPLGLVIHQAATRGPEQVLLPSRESQGWVLPTATVPNHRWAESLWLLLPERPVPIAKLASQEE